MSSGSELGVVHNDSNARKKQVITFAYWAIREVLQEQHVSALAGLTHAQRAGESIAPHAAKLAALEDVEFAFQQALMKEKDSKLDG